VFFDLRTAAFVNEVALKRIVGTGRVEALVALYAGFGRTAFNDVIAMTVGAAHRDEYHSDILHKRMPVWHRSLPKYKAETLPNCLEL
jgi:hypothetical protein